MKNRHQGPIPKGKQPCYQCEGWGVTHYSAEEIGKAVTCSVCEGEGLRDLPPESVYQTVDEEFDEWLSAQACHGVCMGGYTFEEEIIARAAWKAAQERYDDGN